jgi:hypothetical protein
VSSQLRVKQACAYSFRATFSLPKELMGTFQFRTAMAWQRVNSPEQVNP